MITGRYWCLTDPRLTKRTVAFRDHDGSIYQASSGASAQSSKPRTGEKFSNVLTSDTFNCNP